MCGWFNAYGQIVVDTTTRNQLIIAMSVSVWVHVYICRPAMCNMQAGSTLSRHTQHTYTCKRFARLHYIFFEGTRNKPFCLVGAPDYIFFFIVLYILFEGLGYPSSLWSPIVVIFLIHCIIHVCTRIIRFGLTTYMCIREYTYIRSYLKSGVVRTAVYSWVVLVFSLTTNIE